MVCYVTDLFIVTVLQGVNVSVACLCPTWAVNSTQYTDSHGVSVFHETLLEVRVGAPGNDLAICAAGQDVPLV